MSVDLQYERELGAHLRELRKAREMTQEDVAAKFQLEGCNVSRSALAKIEVAQRHVYPDELKIFCKIFQITYDELFV